MKNELRFSFDYGGFCLWANDGAIEPNALPISQELIDEINSLCDEFDTSLDWEYHRILHLGQKKNGMIFLKGLN